MWTRSVWRRRPATLQQMFRKLKLAGAHPDILWSVDAEKAQHNGDEMIRLETLMHACESGAAQQRPRPGDGHGAAQHFLFWLRDGDAATVRAVQCTITPAAHTRIVQQQLARLFRDAGIADSDNFALHCADDAHDLRSSIAFARQQQSEQLSQAAALHVRADAAVDQLRRFGILVALEERGQVYLVTLPETSPSLACVTCTPCAIPATSSYSSSSSSAGESDTAAIDATTTTRRAIVGPQGEVDETVQHYLHEHHMQPLDLRMLGGTSAMERIVAALERLERLYEVHRGAALRSCVALVLSCTSAHNYVAADGCIVLTMQGQATWDEYLLSLPQVVWRACVQQHCQWRLGTAPRLRARQRACARLADALHVWRVRVDAPLGGCYDVADTTTTTTTQVATTHACDAGDGLWPDAFLHQLLKDEAVMRRTMAKYNMASEVLKRRGVVQFVDALYSAHDTTTSIDYRVCADGTFTFHRRRVHTGQVLRVLRDNVANVAAQKLQYDNLVAQLDRVARVLPLDFSICTHWKARIAAELVPALQQLVQSIHAHRHTLERLLCSNGDDTRAATLASSTSPQTTADIYTRSTQQQQQQLGQRRMTWVVSDQLQVLPHGIVYVPYNVDMTDLAQHLLDTAPHNTRQTDVHTHSRVSA